MNEAGEQGWEEKKGKKISPSPPSFLMIRQSFSSLGSPRDRYYFLALKIYKYLEKIMSTQTALDLLQNLGQKVTNHNKGTFPECPQLQSSSDNSTLQFRGKDWSYQG